MDVNSLSLNRILVFLSLALILCLAAVESSSGTCTADRNECDANSEPMRKYGPYLPKVTIISPTCVKRHQFHSNLIRMFQHQRYGGEKELLIYDGACKSKSSDDKSVKSKVVLKAMEEDSRIRYYYEPLKIKKGEDHVKLGSKRNWMIANSTGEIIVHFDDDDYYGPNYLQHMITTMIMRKAVMIKLIAWFIYGEQYQDGRRTESFAYYDYTVSQSKGWGWNLVYRKELLDQVKFRDADFMEEDHFVNTIFTNGNKVHFMQDKNFLAMKFVTGSLVRSTGMPLCKTSGSDYKICDRYELPRWLAEKSFGSQIKDWIKMVNTR
ncbi:uncharacterized protein TRIADDRAFT_58019 [Trichoplax adhaerens]|uniref:Glycosyltransferase 2-like domain-containing protein n=1 Tax=Trichoplax adhaerens TaxID=10228 RepID=B3S2G7_TRIAD|nr:hypothetical protein TRIADDRAFT_58019 [Trichoplax adhaerens]EDV23094.1 hypothetical protein TRIADDRAFT_58019 [Trichoplax adhaerens]|eukprot:XP_002114004.1 hypothetical protein TRIADDRAFT_58019 [Trichoplax adhaerens]